MVKRLNQEPINEDLAAKIAGLRRGTPETQTGFRPLALAVQLSPTNTSRPAKRLMTSSRVAAVYAVTLAEPVTKDGRNYGREFVFKALLRIDKDRPIPSDLYYELSTERLRDPIEVENKVNELKRSIINEFQMGAALTQVSRVMQVFEIAQIDNEFGILCEKIDGETVRSLVPKAALAVADSIITGPEYFDLARQALMDVLVGIARCADEGVAHSDITHNNVMYDKEEKLFKLIDMGGGREPGTERSTATKGYVDQSTVAAGEAYDVYAAGQFLAHFVKHRGVPVSGYTGFAAEQLTQELFPFMEELDEVPSDDKIAMLNLIRRMTNADPTARPSAAELLHDPFFENCATRDLVHQCYEMLDHWAQSRQISDRFTRYYSEIESAEDKDRIYGMVFELNEAWRDEEHDRQADIKALLSRLNAPSVQHILKVAENRQLNTH